MAINDPLGDMLTRIRNAQMRKRPKVSTPGSKLRARVLDVLQAEGYIRGYNSTEFGNGRTEFEVELKYYDGQPVIREIARVSKPGRRVYSTVAAVPRVANGLGMAILSTPLGVMADHEARERHVGGEVLCTIF
ncbi:MAG: 30S ribosomal protein S8 [Hyphomicrobiales bacterium]|nr:30S ribosomal protein S8 [Hyphomicrobiales bacterium]MBV8770549.1 30S ribosomal protein S8 [Hyphomicrobiales bacterium]MBV9054203.1 30S ribosomal protein S8 [Hyphomicrobiales bacterium]MBV9139080.1 30S ribosomal protein S8 [Hyphomicrobiales bacterium]MBV9590708.1 30S ribosomal protein S8 [Hyphomicrobiales bacterium]